MKFRAENEEEAEKIIEELDKLADLLIKKTKIKKRRHPKFERIPKRRIIGTTLLSKRNQNANQN